VGSGHQRASGGLTRLRLGELLALLGALCVIVALLLPWYEAPSGSLSAWDTFGPAIVLLIAGAAAALGLVAATLTERSTALPVAAAVWSTLFAIVALIAAVVRLLERPDHASSICAGAWLALAGALAMLTGSWQSMRDERTGSYPPGEPPRRPAPPP
jgi:drug/metabolite transporter (DMT)-like permease